jgi:hypothetical protein
VKLFGCKLHTDDIPGDLAKFFARVKARQAHAEVNLFVTEWSLALGQLLAYDSEVYTLQNENQRLDSAMCMYLVDPVDIKVSYVRAGSPLQLDCPRYRRQLRAMIGLPPLS